MQRLSINQLSSFRWSFFQDVVRYSQLGAGTIGVWRSKLDEIGVDEAADLLFEMQMSVSSLSWVGGFTGSNGASHAFAVEDAMEAVYQAHLIGARNLIFHPGGRNNHTTSHANRLLKSAIDPILEIAADLGVRLVLEPNADVENPCSFLSSLNQYLDFVGDYDPEYLGFNVDLFEVGANFELFDRFEEFASHVALVQLADRRFRNTEAVRCSLGRGFIPLADWLQMLEDTGYGGEFELKLHGYEFEGVDYAQTLRSNWTALESALDRVSMATVRV